MNHSTTIPTGKRTLGPLDQIVAEEVVDPVRVTLLELSIEAEEAAKVGEKPALQRLLARDQFIKADAEIAHRTAGELLHPHMTEKIEVVDGLGIFEKRTAATQTVWEHEALAMAVVDAAMERGDIAHPHDVARVLMDCAGISYWRVGDEDRGLKRYGLDPDAFRDKVHGRRYVQFKPTTSAGVK
jgi:hypothetical protein